MVVVSNVEILGRPNYQPIKVRLRDELNPLNKFKSKKSNPPLTHTDLVYERDVTDENLANYEGSMNKLKTK
jgi:hypothetical protein